jgi:hypoxanthine phosphoribosyltransferase
VLRTFVNYHEYGVLLNLLTLKLQDTREKFDGVFGVPRGGLPIAVHIAHQLEIPLIISPLMDYVDKNILVVDDICDSGATFERLLVTNHKYASLFLRYTSHFVPHVWASEISSDDWIVFPWEKKDALTERNSLTKDKR